MGLGFTLDFLGIVPDKTVGFVKNIKNIGRKNLRLNFFKQYAVNASICHNVTGSIPEFSRYIYQYHSPHNVSVRALIQFISYLHSILIHLYRQKKKKLAIHLFYRETILIYVY